MVFHGGFTFLSQRVMLESMTLYLMEAFKRIQAQFEINPNFEEILRS